MVLPHSKFGLEAGLIRNLFSLEGNFGWPVLLGLWLGNLLEFGLEGIGLEGVNRIGLIITKLGLWEVRCYMVENHFPDNMMKMAEQVRDLMYGMMDAAATG